MVQLSANKANKIRLADGFAVKVLSAVIMGVEVFQHFNCYSSEYKNRTALRNLASSKT